MAAMYHFLPTLASPMKTVFLSLLLTITLLHAAEKPHIVLVMSDDQGWGQTGYMNHPDLKTPHLDEMAASGLRFNRFYAGASNCSPTRATVMTGRTNDRTGVFNHGFPLRLQEKTVAQALKEAGYATAHFGKWHLNGLRGPGVPVLGNDTHSPGAFGFDRWLTVTNFYDRDPLLSRRGDFEDYKGDSSEIVIEQALKFIKEKSPDGPTFTVVWYGTPHSPFVASAEDRAPFSDLPEDYQNQYGEIVAMDRSIGTLRKSLREMDIADNTLVWFCSDNGGLAQFGPETMGGLRGSKNTMYEGGLRVPCVVEWPSVIKEGRITDTIAGTVDIFPTLADILGLPGDVMLNPIDGESILPLIQGKDWKRDKPLAFRHDGRGDLISADGNYKLMVSKDGEIALYDLIKDPTETSDLKESMPDLAREMLSEWTAWNDTVDASVAGADYPGGKVDPNQPERRFWTDEKAYAPYIDQFKKRPEYKDFIERMNRQKRKQKKQKE